MRQRCESCPTKADCVSAFGIYWDIKSSGGVGCEYPFAYRRDVEGGLGKKRPVVSSPEKGRRWR